MPVQQANKKLVSYKDLLIIAGLVAFNIAAIVYAQSDSASEGAPMYLAVAISMVLIICVATLRNTLLGISTVILCSALGFLGDAFVLSTCTGNCHNGHGFLTIAAAAGSFVFFIAWGVSRLTRKKQ